MNEFLRGLGARAARTPDRAVLRVHPSIAVLAATPTAPASPSQRGRSLAPSPTSDESPGPAPATARRATSSAPVAPVAAAGPVARAVDRASDAPGWAEPAPVLVPPRASRRGASAADRVTLGQQPRVAMEDAAGAGAPGARPDPVVRPEVVAPLTRRAAAPSDAPTIPTFTTSATLATPVPLAPPAAGSSLLPPRAASSAAAVAPAAPTPPVEIVIDRVDVRVVAPSTTSTRRPAAAPAPHLSLADYLDRRTAR